VALLLALVGWAQAYLQRYGGEFHPLVFNRGERPADLEARVPKLDAAALMAKGKRVYGVYCEACHRADGLGTPNQFPALSQAEWVLAPGPNRLIRIALDGMQGQVTVKGASFDATMLPWRDQLSDEDIAAVLTFIRGHKDWGHNASAVSPGQVKAVRAATQAHSPNPWTALELLNVSEQD
jgi:mono/diheme cytochrome c family protein